ncbi:MAG: aminopeptidase P family protein [Phreatobacter sp.]|uniref:aminopeptidase P family protein n=1 Tax=Phreatobacter sp. TaxID=1966341 RepID=UPI002733BD39|nr:aminopeptidase P family protein [Phreatobacter sp.]MDP2804206.1 aminopeptidase P family protein [Phreatobacter sp.]
MPVDLEALKPLLARVRATPPGKNTDGWMAAACPDATAADRQVIAAALAAVPVPAFTRDAARIPALQKILKKEKLAAFLVPRADEHQGEYLVARAERLQWLTGFSGSAGFAIILQKEAALFVDGRYTLQAPAETDASVIECRHFKKPPAIDWLAGKVKAGDRVGFDPRITPVKEAERWREALGKAGAALVALDSNPIDAIWTGQPGDPFSAILAQPLKFAGEASGDKRSRIGQEIAARGARAAVLNQLDSIAWLLNVRGGDTPATPLVQSFLILAADGHATWFVDQAKFTPGLTAHLGNGVTVRPLEAFAEGLQEWSGKAVTIEPETATAWIADRLTAAGATLIHGEDPSVLPKARKNRVELAGTRKAHARDGAAMARFLHWVDREAVGQGELAVMAKLEEIRGADALHRGASFTTIAGAGSNGAIVHYRSSPATERKVEKGTFLLVDSGAQYLDGTTDITRTIAVGGVPKRLREHYTLVLKGHIAVATARFPKGTGGIAIDGFARRALWQAGLDFDHGTGHGVGVYLGVHEGPARISPLSQVPLEPGMILSNEPGFYETGSHGIRLENLIVVTESAKPGFLEFETITFCPFDRRAIVTNLLTTAERQWLDAYHKRTWNLLEGRVTGADRPWLKRMTAPL